MDQNYIQTALFRIALLALAGLALLGLASFWLTPTYTTGVQIAVDTFKQVIELTLFGKVALAQPGQPK